MINDDPFTIIAIILISVGIFAFGFSIGRSDLKNDCEKGYPIAKDNRIYKCVEQKMEGVK